MSATSSPFGLQPVYRRSGGDVRPVERPILSTYNTSIYQYTPVKIHTDGTINVAAAGDRMVGSFLGVSWTDADGKRRISNRWVAGTTGTDIVALVTEDPDIVYRIQAGAPVAVGDVGNMADHSGTSGNSVTGYSTTALGTLSASTEATYQVLGIDQSPDNAAGDAYTIVQVVIAEHQFRPMPDSSQAF